MLDILERAALAAGKAILDIYHAGPDVSYKADCSPVTDADNMAEEIILKDLATAFPDIPIVAEEQAAAGHIPDIENRLFFLVDPLDGTKEFISRHNDFTVNIALIEKGIPIAGVVYAPALGVLYAAARGRAEKFAVTDTFTIGERIIIGCRSRGDKLTALASRSHNSSETLAYMNERGIEDYEAIGSSLKFCLLAEGAADIYPRFSRTMEWDTAAGDAVLRAAGGETLTMDGHPLTYGKRNQSRDVDFANPSFVSRGKG
ncbi:3'(2'),5'-bisphosphate nucleotidase CysQ [Pararhizobium antarcticum]|uniref:3'(2'),5'-bisphosphate nucleotidase CysQ n=1 Tax=Pararhizobium antarcticum TaxID=1798805 RepID=A0A657LTT9_9HYPH|nr:3'(2'),5'-bisphosphate nucleotidase CysQ [Pararhizobium antarcticum]OJF97844.1 3'(2'),5'-bisphosphate nucleotidase CysQ [Rhizobium sp. 58]OJF98276.1 3'(2'),5'-bisphosphate nucleotidase CysQ [Pararhizobium antarcticum]